MDPRASSSTSIYRLCFDRSDWATGNHLGLRSIENYMKILERREGTSMERGDFEHCYTSDIEHKPHDVCDTHRATSKHSRWAVPCTKQLSGAVGMTQSVKCFDIQA